MVQRTHSGSSSRSDLEPVVESTSRIDPSKEVSLIAETERSNAGSAQSCGRESGNTMFSTCCVVGSTTGNASIARGTDDNSNRTQECNYGSPAGREWRKTAMMPYMLTMSCRSARETRPDNSSFSHFSSDNWFVRPTNSDRRVLRVRRPNGKRVRSTSETSPSVS
jgi:hypothetical protein